MRVRETGLAFMILTIIAFLSIHDCHTVAESDAILAIKLAEDSAELAYLNVLEVEKVGGDVDDLVFALNMVLEYLSTAKNAFAAGDFEKAVAVSRQVVDSTRTINDVAQSAKIAAERERSLSQRNQILLTALTSVLIVILGYFSWNVFKARYYRRLMALKPEASEVEP